MHELPKPCSIKIVTPFPGYTRVEGEYANTPSREELENEDEFELDAAEAAGCFFAAKGRALSHISHIGSASWFTKLHLPHSQPPAPVALLVDANDGGSGCFDSAAAAADDCCASAVPDVDEAADEDDDDEDDEDVEDGFGTFEDTVLEGEGVDEEEREGADDDDGELP